MRCGYEGEFFNPGTFEFLILESARLSLPFIPNIIKYVNGSSQFQKRYREGQMENFMLFCFYLYTVTGKMENQSIDFSRLLNGAETAI